MVAAATRRDDAGVTQTIRVEEDAGGVRIDVFLHDRLEGGHSRSWIKEVVKLGNVTVDGARVKPSHRVAPGEVIVAHVPGRPERGDLVPQDIPIDIRHEDATLLLVNKPAGLVVHPGNGRADGTLANALAFHLDELSDVGGDLRPGIVHRLDRDTTGIMVVAKTNAAHFALASQFQDRTTAKEYLAIVEGEVHRDGDVIDKPLGRSPSDAARVIVDEGRGKEAVTIYEVEERFRGYTLVRCRPKTGRTHQIRVHLASIGHPIVCDPTYGRRERIRVRELARDVPEDEDVVLLERHALHAHRLEFHHPLQGERVQHEAPLPADMERLLEALRLWRPRTERKAKT